MVDGNAAVVLRRNVPVSFPLVAKSKEQTANKTSYVAMHAMQEDAHTHDHATPSSNGYGDSGSQQRKPKGPQMRDTLATMAGMLLPLLTQFGHHH